MQIEYTDEFRKCLKKIRDKKLQVKIKKIVEKIIENPEVGKPLQYELAGMRSVRIPPFRILYEYNHDHLILYTFEHRDSVYK
ncbi:MAG: Plasmid stabilization system protein [Euryarchaeota archaeon ADurb.Bin294]|jgi:addiction module RelE/StbE family toxin|nr:MAG: Plasmid stabilization system protein [Euryarchaeota archaeon ADurb.Bin294]